MGQCRFSGSSGVMAKEKEGGEVHGVYDVVVVGAGIMGSCAAYQIAKRGKTVLLVEQFDFLHRRGSSHGESRTIRVTYPEDYYTRMMKEAYKLWEEAESEAGYMVYQRTGHLDFGSPYNQSLLAVISSLQKEGVPHQILSHKEVAIRFPTLRLPEDSLVIYTSQGGILQASKAVAMFQALAAKHGAVLRDRAKVLRVSPHWRLPDGSDGILVGTGRGSALGKACILAAGAWTPQLVRDISGLELPIKALHTSIAYWAVNKINPDALSPTRGFPSFADYSEPYIYGTPSIEYPGLVKVSVHSGVLCDPNRRSVSPDMEALKGVVSPWLASHFKGSVKWEAPIMAEGCMYSMTPDQDFILDHLPYSSKTEMVGINVLDCKQGFFAQNGRRAGQGRRIETARSQGSLPYLPEEADPDHGISSETEAFVQNGVESLQRDQLGICKSQILVAAGFSGHGFKMGPLVGRVMADLALTGVSQGVPLEMFSIERFTKDAGGNHKLYEAPVKPVPQATIPRTRSS